MLWTKVHIPQSKKNTVHRFHLYEKLDEGLDRKLILVSAGAGFGKTTLLCDWVRKNEIPTAWFSIDESDNEAYEFLSILISSIQTIDKQIGQDSLELLKAPGTVTTEYILELLINDVLRIKKTFLLVLDDLHVINNKEIFTLLNLIIERKPEQFKMAILTRSDPPLNIARLRSQLELLEIRLTDLSFSEKDIAEYFNKKLRLGLSEREINLLKGKTEGWIAGLQLTAISLQGKSDISEFIESIAGESRYIMDYLIEEVLNNQDEEIRSFLLKTSILKKFSASLCDAVLQRSNSQLLLESLEKSNMFIVPLDNERQWYRYHHLFRDLLKKRLLSANKDHVPGLHDRASIWFEESQMHAFAIEHAIKAGRIEKALDLVDGIVDYLWETSQFIIIYQLGNLLPDDEIYTNKNFGIIYAWVLAIKGELAEAEKHVRRIEQDLLSEEPGKENRALLGRVYETLNLVKVFSGDVEAAFTYSELAIRHIPEEDIIWYSWAHISFGESNLLHFELDKSIESFRIARENAKGANNLYLDLISTSKIAYVSRLKGEYSAALGLCNELLQTFNAITNIEGYRIGLLSSILYSIVGYIKAEQGQQEEGIRHSLKGYKLSRGVLSLSFQAYNALLLAKTYYKAGEFDKALDIIDELEKIINRNIAQWLYVLTNSLKCKLLILKHEYEKAHLLLKRKGETGKNHAFENVFYDVEAARYKIARQENREALSLLENLSGRLENSGATELMAEVELLKAKAFLSLSEKENAVDAVLISLKYTQQENFIRTYINEGEEIESILKEIEQRKKIKSSEVLDAVSGEYIEILIRSFDKEKRRTGVISEEVISRRELDILKLIAEDLSNQEIANTLYISITTVKTHVRNILLKLDANNRSQAVSKAREKQII